MSIEEALSRADTSGRFHKSALAAVLVATWCGGSSGGVSQFLMTPVSSEGTFEPWEMSLFASSLFIGMWAGSFAGGLLCDLFGPARTMASTLLGLGAGGLAPALLPVSALAFSASRLAVGFSMVICFQAGNTYVAECCPTSLRSAYMSILHIGIAAGALCSAILALVVSSEHWRQLLVISAVPTILITPFVIRFARSHESPRWLLVSGCEEDCKLLLCRIHEGDACVDSLTSLRGRGGSGRGSPGDVGRRVGEELAVGFSTLRLRLSAGATDEAKKPGFGANAGGGSGGIGSGGGDGDGSRGGSGSSFVSRLGIMFHRSLWRTCTAPWPQTPLPCPTLEPLSVRCHPTRDRHCWNRRRFRTQLRDKRPRGMDGSLL